MAQTQVAVRVEFEDLPLLQSTIDEYIAEIRALTDHCYECAELPCRRHAPRIAELGENAEALAIGMLRIY